MADPGDASNPDFFISYTQADVRWARWIASALEKEGARTIYQERDFGVGTHFVNEVHNAVQRADRIVLVLSEAYLGSKYAAAEWQAGWAADPEGATRRLVPVRIENCERPGLLGPIAGVDLFGIDGETARARLGTMVNGGGHKPGSEPNFPGGAGRADGVEPPFPGEPPVWNVPPRVAHFVGRRELLDELDEKLSVSSAVEVVAVEGMGGVGKTALALQYAYEHAGDFDVVWWLPAERGDLIGEHLGALGEALGLPAGAEPALVMAALRRRGRWLLIVDNAEKLDDVASLRPTGGGGRLLVTSRRTGWQVFGDALTVPTLDRAEAVELLSTRVRGIEPGPADRIAAALGDLALAVEQAAGYLTRTPVRPDRFAVFLETRLGDLLAKGQVADRPGVTVSTLWALSVERLRAESPASVELLDLLSLCAPDAVPLSLFDNKADQMGEGPLREAADNEVRWEETVALLAGYSLARREGDRLSVHRLVQEAVRHRLSDQRRKQALGLLVALLKAELPGEVQRNPEAWPAWRLLLPHVQAVADHCSTPDETADLAWLLDRAAICLDEHGQVGEALPMCRRALAITENIHGPGHPEVVARLNVVAVALRHLGRPGEALSMLQRAPTVDDAASGLDRSLVSQHLNNLALVLQDLGRPGEALTIFRRALEIAEDYYGRDDPVVAVRLNNLALVLHELGRAGEALPLLQTALKIDEDSYGRDDPDVAIDLNSMAMVLRTLGRVDEARALLERALNIQKDSYGPDHPQTAAALNNLALALQDLRGAGEAVPLFERALAITERAYGFDHPEVAAGLNNVGLALRSLGRVDEALPRFERALNIVERAYGPDHREVAARLNSLAKARRDLGRPEEALPLFQRALDIAERTYGFDHPSCQEIRGSIEGMAT